MKKLLIALVAVFLMHGVAWGIPPAPSKLTVLSNCATIVGGCCLDSDDGLLYCWNGSAAVLTGTGFPAAPVAASFLTMGTDRTLATTTSFDITLTNGYYLVGSSSSVAESIDPEVVAASSGSLTAAKCRGNIITNYGQPEENNLQSLPAAAQGLGFIAVVGTAQAANYFRLQAAAGNKIYLNGVAGSDNGYITNAAPAVGEMITCFTFQTGASDYDWICRSTDDWAAGGP